MLNNALSIIEEAVLESANAENANCDVHITLDKPRFGNPW